MSESLEHLLADLHDDGNLDSRGRFTLDSEVAMAKLGRYALPSPELWILKMVQAAVLAGAPSLDVKQLAKETTLSFPCPSTWNPDHLDAAFHLQEDACDPALARMLEGLWSLSLNDGRPFRLDLPGSEESLVWSGNSMTRLPASTDRFLLTVGIRKRSEGAGLFLLKGFQATSRHSAEAKTLTTRAYCAPLELRLDKRRLDGLQFAPLSYGHPYTMGWVPGQEMRIPPGTLQHVVPEPGEYAGQYASRDKSLWESFFASRVESSPEASLAWMLSAHFHLSTQGNTTKWRTGSGESTFSWVKSGVILSTYELDIPTRSVSLTVLLGADDLDTDLSGFRLLDTAPMRERREGLEGVLRPILDDAPPVCLRGYIEESAKESRMFAAAVGVGGLIMLAQANPVGLLMMGGAVVASSQGGTTFQKLETELQDDHIRLVHDVR